MPKVKSKTTKVRKKKRNRTDRRRKRRQKRRSVNDDDDYALTAPDTNPLTIELLNSLHQIGFRNESRLRVRVSPYSGRGLYTTRSISPNESLLSMPAAAIVTADRLCREEPFHYGHFLIGKNNKKINKDDPKFKQAQTAALTYFLMREYIRSPQSPRSSSCEWYGPYVNHLFSGATNTKCSLSLPCFWLPHDLIRYGSPILPRRFIKSILKSNRNMNVYYHHILPILTSKMSATNADFTRCDDLTRFPYFAVAYQAITTRSFSIDVDIHGAVTSQPSEKEQLALIPFFDFLNFRTSSQNRIKEPDLDLHTDFSLPSSQRKLLMSAGRRISSRRQVFLSISTHCNRELFVRYGFTTIRSAPQTANFDLTISDDSRSPNALSRSMLRVTPTYEDEIAIKFCDLTEWIESFGASSKKIEALRRKLAEIRGANIFTDDSADIQLRWPFERDAAPMNDENANNNNNNSKNNQMNDIIVNARYFTLAKPAQNEASAANDDDFQAFVPEKRLDAIIQIMASIFCESENLEFRMFCYSQGIPFIGVEYALFYDYLWRHFIDFLLDRDYKLKFCPDFDDDDDGDDEEDGDDEDDDDDDEDDDDDDEDGDYGVRDHGVGHHNVRVHDVRDHDVRDHGVRDHDDGYDRESYRERMRVNILKFCYPDYGPAKDDDDEDENADQNQDQDQDQDEDEEEDEEEDHNTGRSSSSSSSDPLVVQRLIGLIENEIALLIYYRNKMQRYIMAKFGMNYNYN